METKTECEHEWVNVGYDFKENAEFEKCKKCHLFQKWEIEYLTEQPKSVESEAVDQELVHEDGLVAVEEAEEELDMQYVEPEAPKKWYRLFR